MWTQNQFPINSATIFCFISSRRSHYSRLCLVSGLLNVGGLEVLLVVVPAAGHTNPTCDKNKNQHPIVPADRECQEQVDGDRDQRQPASELRGGQQQSNNDEAGVRGQKQPSEDVVVLFYLLDLIAGLCSAGSSSLGYQAFSLLRLWCQRLQVEKESFPTYDRTGANGCR
jgi:hypothetical protein